MEVWFQPRQRNSRHWPRARISSSQPSALGHRRWPDNSKDLDQIYLMYQCPALYPLSHLVYWPLINVYLGTFRSSVNSYLGPLSNDHCLSTQWIAALLRQAKPVSQGEWCEDYLQRTRLTTCRCTNLADGGVLPPLWSLRKRWGIKCMPSAGDITSVSTISTTLRWIAYWVSLINRCHLFWIVGLAFP